MVLEPNARWWASEDIEPLREVDGEISPRLERERNILIRVWKPFSKKTIFKTMSLTMIHNGSKQTISDGFGLVHSFTCLCPLQ